MTALCGTLSAEDRRTACRRAIARKTAAILAEITPACGNSSRDGDMLDAAGLRFVTAIGPVASGVDVELRMGVFGTERSGV